MATLLDFFKRKWCNFHKLHFFSDFSAHCIYYHQNLWMGNFLHDHPPLDFYFYLSNNRFIYPWICTEKSWKGEQLRGAADTFFKPSNEMKFRPPFFIANFLDRGSKNIISNKTRTLGLIYWYAVRVVGKILHKQNGFTKYWPDHQ